MQLSPLKFCLLTGGILFYLLAPKPTTAQIVPDTTLPKNSIVPPNCTNCEITGGTTLGKNLFHSFVQFSIPTGGTAYFNNAPTIENIISRVTGNSISNIDGLIRANPTANLFLLNPNGIIFGPNASLNVGGSFIASTASRLKFADGTEFNATTTQATPLLTISVPMGLGFGETPGKIVNRAASVDTDRNPIGLQVPSGKTLALVGGEVALEGGFLTTPGGRIELGSVSSNSLVKLTPIDKGWMLGYEGIQNFQDINLSQAAFAGSSDFKGADIQIQGRRVTITEGSQVYSTVGTDGQPGNILVNAKEQLELVGTPTDSFLTTLSNEVDEKATGEGRILAIETKRLIVQGGAQVSTNTFGTGQGVELRVSASESVELAGNSLSLDLPSGLFTRVDKEGSGKGGTLTIETNRLTLENGGQVSTTTFGAGKAGDLRVIASESVKLAGRTPDNTNGSGLFAQVRSGATGDGGNLTIETKKLDVLGGAQISTAARNTGNGGNLTINASESIQLSGTAPPATAELLDSYRSGIFVSAEPGATGNVGNLNLNTRLLTVENGARISADNFGTGQGRTANLNVNQLVIRNGGEVRSGSFAEGPGGTLNVNATDSVQVIGTGTIASTPVKSTLFAQALASGKAGDLNITTPSLNVQDGAEVTVSSKGSGPAGNLTVTANDVRLNRGSLTATTNAGEGANIKLQGVDLLLLQNQSQISAQAFNNGSGGNIEIDARNGVVAAVPGQNNDIIANAFEGPGGKITITTRGIFGIAERNSTPANTTNDIDASSQFNQPGTVTINTPDVDPVRSLFTLPTAVVEASGLVASSCAAFADSEGSTFVVTGRGGLPPSPNEPLSNDVVWSDTRLTSIDSGGNKRASTTSSQVSPKTSDRIAIVPATGWVFNKEKGEVTLIARSPSDTPQGLGSTPAGCLKH